MVSSEVAIGAYLLAGGSLSIPAYLLGRRLGRLDVLEDPDEFIDEVRS